MRVEHKANIVPGNLSTSYHLLKLFEANFKHNKKFFLNLQFSNFKVQIFKVHRSICNIRYY